LFSTKALEVGMVKIRVRLGRDMGGGRAEG
jgi:hypothetical protein